MKGWWVQQVLSLIPVSPLRILLLHLCRKPVYLVVPAVPYFLHRCPFQHLNNLTTKVCLTQYSLTNSFSRSAWEKLFIIFRMYTKYGIEQKFCELGFRKLTVLSSGSMYDLDNIHLASMFRKRRLSFFYVYPAVSLFSSDITFIIFTLLRRRLLCIVLAGLTVNKSTSFRERVKSSRSSFSIRMND